jgi:hypothetical protein
MKLDLSAPAIAARLRQASEHTDLHPDRRLQAKLDLTADGIARRIKASAQMLALCRSLGAWRRRS